MKKIATPIIFKKTIPSLLLSTSIALFAGYSSNAIADPIANTVIAKGTLSRIVDKNYPNSKLSKAQIMMAILAKNPRAFRGGNINYMLRNKQLSLPSEDVIAAIPEENAAALLEKHNRFYRRGETGNLTPPTFIDTGDKETLKKLKEQNALQSKQVEAISEESKKLQALVARLEAEKAQRDRDLQELENKIQELKKSGGVERTSTGELSLNEQRLIDKNAALQQKLVESKSELAENNRTTISLERRLEEMQQQRQDATATDQTPIADGESIVAPTSNAVDTPESDLNNNVANAPEQNESSGFDFGKLTWLLPLLAIIAGLGLLLKRFFARKQHSDLNLDEVDDYDFTTPKMTKEQRSDEFLTNDTKDTSVDAPLEVSIKLDVARAYMEADDNRSAYEMLNEVLLEGNEAQQEEANKLLAKL